MTRSSRNLQVLYLWLRSSFVLINQFARCWCISTAACCVVVSGSSQANVLGLGISFWHENFHWHRAMLMRFTEVWVSSEGIDHHPPTLDQLNYCGLLRYSANRLGCNGHETFFCCSDDVGGWSSEGVPWQIMWWVSGWDRSIAKCLNKRFMMNLFYWSFPVASCRCRMYSCMKAATISSGNSKIIIANSSKPKKTMSWSCIVCKLSESSSRHLERIYHFIMKLASSYDSFGLWLFVNAWNDIESETSQTKPKNFLSNCNN